MEETLTKEEEEIYVLSQLCSDSPFSYMCWLSVPASWCWDALYSEEARTQFHRLCGVFACELALSSPHTYVSLTQNMSISDSKELFFIETWHNPREVSALRAPASWGLLKLL